MRLNRIALKAIGLVAISLLAVAGVLAIAEWAEGLRAAGEEYAVYSAYLSNGLLNDAHERGASGPVQVVVKSNTSPGENLRIKTLFVFDGNAKFAQLERSTRASYVVRNIFSTRLLPKFQLPGFAKLTFISRLDHFSPEFQQQFPHSEGILVLSGVGFNRDRTQAVFYIDDFCGLCGGGRYVLMAKIDGKWRIQAEHWIWIS